MAANGFPLNVMTFNLRRRKPSDGPNTWDLRRDAALAVVRKYGADVVGTQEGLAEQVDYLEDGLPGYGAIGESRFGGRNDEANAILYRRDRVEPVESGNFWLSDTPDVPGSRTWGNYVPRMATWARFRRRDNGAEFFMINTHLDHLVPGARRKGAQLIEERIPDDGTPAILTGDFNALPRGGTYRYLTRNGENGPGLVDTLTVAEKRRPSRWNATYHHFTGRGLYRIDYVFARNPERVHRHVIIRDKPHGKHPSDHFPVYVELELMNTPSAASGRSGQ